jgi:hypothetical protein
VAKETKAYFQMPLAARSASDSQMFTDVTCPCDEFIDFKTSLTTY